MKFLNNVDVNSNNVFFTDSVMGTSESLYPNATDSIVIYSLNASDYLGAKFLVKTISGTDQSIREILAMYVGSQGYITEYAIVSTTETGIYNDTYTFVFSSDTSTYDLVLTPSVSGERNVNVFSTGIVANAIDYYDTPAFSPLDISGLSLWLDAADTTSITESGGAVSQWDDKSGNAYNFSQGTAANQPTTGTRTINSLNVIDFDGSQEFLGTTSTINDTQGHVFIIFQKDNINDPSTMFGGGSSSNATQLHLFLSDDGTGNPGIQAQGGNIYSFTSTVGTGTPSLYELASNGSTWSGWLDGGSETLTQVAGTNNGDWLGDRSFTLISVGAVRQLSNMISHFNGVIGEILLYDRLLSSSERQSVEGYLASKWAITLS